MRFLHDSPAGAGRVSGSVKTVSDLWGQICGGRLEGAVVGGADVNEDKTGGENGGP